MLKRIPILPDIKRIDYNTNNIHEYDPYIIQNDSILIDTDWWESLTYYTKKCIEVKLNGKFELGLVKVPHEKQCDTTNKVLSIIYQSYLDGFDYNVWYNSNIPNGPKNVKIIHIPDTIKKILLRIYMKEINICDEELYNFKKQIKKCIINENEHQTLEYFVRLSSTSGKNIKAIEPFRNENEIISHLTSNKLFATQEYSRDKDTYLIMIPWNELIIPKYEFRIFVVNNKLTGASPQKFWELYQYSQEELEIFEVALSNIQFIGYVQYHTFVADVYIDMETKTCNLIELNAFGAHCGAGSSLFNWITDYDVLHGISQPELRYLSIINY